MAPELFPSIALTETTTEVHHNVENINTAVFMRVEATQQFDAHGSRTCKGRRCFRAFPKVTLHHQ